MWPIPLILLVLDHATATENCDGSPLSPGYSDDNSGLDACGLGTIVRTWSVTDFCGNTDACDQFITIVDNTAPVISGVGPDATIDCPLTPVFSTPSASDACDPNPSLNFSDNDQRDNCGLGPVTRTWTATDCAGNTTTASQTITVRDITPPIISGVGPDATIDCPLTPVFSTPSASDACDPNPSLNFSDNDQRDNCGLGPVTRTWTATDCAGNTTTASQTITVRDITPPIISGVGPDATIDCPLTPVFSTPSASDACDPNPSLNFSDNDQRDNCGLGPVTRTWTATDCAGNTTTASQTITVRDITPPIISGVGPDATIDCPLTPVFSTPSASDACDPNPSLNFSDNDQRDNCGLGPVTRTWTATDCAGNTTTASQTITVRDITPPIISGVGPDATIDCPLTPVFSTPSASDACDPNPSLNFSDNDQRDNCGLGPVTRTWTATDCAGNTTTASQTITVRDITPPIISGVGPDATIDCPLTPVFSTPSASDACDPNPSLNFSDNDQRDNCGLGPVTRTWTATDCAGNTTTASQTITVRDITPPIISGVGPDATIDCPLTPVFSTPSASDACDPNPSLNFSDNDQRDNCGLGPVTRTWTATDCAGNTTTASQTITVRDITPPIISGVGPDATIDCPLTPVFSTPSASDACDPNPSLNFSDNDQRDNCGLGPVTRTWTATDCAGNTTTASQTITVRDITPPIISGVGPDATIDCPLTPVFSTPSASDACDPNPSLNFSDNDQRDNCGLGPVTRTWTATDCAGNTTTASQTITVRDITPPIISGVGPDATIDCPLTPVFSTPSASDACDPNPSLNFSDNDQRDNCGLGPVTRTWTATDCAGNTTTASQTITVRDITPPIISGVGPDATIDCPLTPVFSTPSASDACDPNPSLNFSDNDQRDNCGLGPVTRTWTATDCAGNTTTASQTITVRDITPPIISGVGPDATIDCPLTPVFSTPSASDACDPNPSLNFSDNDQRDNCGLGPVTRTWTATDCAGNTTTASQTITIRDIDPPVPPTPPANVNQKCPPIPAPVDLTASDACDGDITVSPQQSDNGGSGCAGDPLIYTRTWTFSDCAGNTSSTSQTLTVEADPISCDITGFDPEDAPWCHSEGNELEVIATGGCEPYSYSWSLNLGSSYEITDGQYSSTVTYTAGDVGDTATFSVQITDANGCTGSCEIRVWCKGGAYCGYTQGFYGNEGGSDCEGNTTAQVIDMAIAAVGSPVVVGGGANRLEVATGEASCVILRLPGGGPSAAITSGPNFICGPITGIQVDPVDHRIENTLVAQALTLTLNSGLTPQFLNIDIPVGVDGIATADADSCYYFGASSHPWYGGHYVIPNHRG